MPQEKRTLVSRKMVERLTPWAHEIIFVSEAEVRNVSIDTTERLEC